jgi:hypothetical protein
MDVPTSTRTRRAPRDLAVAAALAAFLFVGLAAVLRSQQRAVTDPALLSSHLDSTGNLRPVADVAGAVRAMKLVTVHIDTTVAVTKVDTSWRGDVEATVRAPARLLYGTDLSRLGDDAVRVGPLGTSYIVRIPRPQRIATEVFAERDRPDVRTGWLRLRSRAGEYYLGLARRSLHEQARELVLAPEDARMVEEATREQVRDLVRAIVGREASVVVVYEGEGL